MKNFYKIIAFVVLLSACDDRAQLPVGFEHVSMDGRAHFMYVTEEYWNDKITQREAARTVCQKLYDHASYCEVYFYGNKREIPTQFPIINRTSPIGVFKMRDGKEQFRSLGGDDNDFISNGMSK